MDSRARMMLDALNLPSALQQSQQPAQPMRYAEGGMVGLPSLADLARPDFNWSSLNSFNPAPSSFTPMTQNVPMFVAQSPAYGNMGQDVYDWKAPTASAPAQPYSTVNQPVAETVDVRVPTSTATVNVPMPSYETPTPNVPTDTYMPGTGTGTDMSPLVDPNYLNPQPPAPAPTTTTPTFTPVTNTAGPDPFEVRRSEAAAELDAFNKRQAEEAARMAEAKRVADEAAAAKVAEDARLARLAEDKRVADKLLSDTQQQQAAVAKREEERIAREAEAKRIADEQAAVVATPAPAAAPAPEPYFQTTNYESGEGYTIYPPGYVEPEPENTWYSGDGG